MDLPPAILAEADQIMASADAKLEKHIQRFRRHSDERHDGDPLCAFAGTATVVARLSGPELPALFGAALARLAKLPATEPESAPARSGATYIAGPMTGLPDFNYPAFRAVAAELRARGVDVRCPTDNDDGSQGKPWDFYMREALRMLVDCDEIVLLPGWESSRGATLERQVAEALGMRITEWVGEAEAEGPDTEAAVVEALADALRGAAHPAPSDLALLMTARQLHKEGWRRTAGPA